MQLKNTFDLKKWSDVRNKKMYVMIFKEIVIPDKRAYSQFHKTLLRSSLQMHWISVRFYEMGDILLLIIAVIKALR